MSYQNIVILGSTGSIGENTVIVTQHLHASVRVIGLAACRNAKKLAEQAIKLNVKSVVISDPEQMKTLQSLLPADTSVQTGTEALVEMATRPDVDIVVCAIVGTAGLVPVLEALKCGKTVALASKEVLVMAGEVVMATADQYGGKLIPVDSEHSAILQCLAGRSRNEVRRLILTASGGPFRHFKPSEFDKITPEMALHHPTWKMGRKITIDSATLMNKALEFIEACYLFQVSPEMVDVVIHPQSLIHSMVEFADGTLLAQMGEPDMKSPIQYALTYPHKVQGLLPPFDFTRFSTLVFEPVPDCFPSIGFARHAISLGKTYPAVLNAANEVAVQRFFNHEIRFSDIFHVVEKTLSAHLPRSQNSLAEILEADQDARRFATQCSFKG